MSTRLLTAGEVAERLGEARQRNGSAFTATSSARRSPRSRSPTVAAGYRDPESQAFIESWFRYLKEGCAWRHEVEALDEQER